MKYKKIIIFGQVASGKTTLAKKVSKILKIKVYNTDDFAYKIKWTVPATKGEFIKKLKKVIKMRSWIIEGVHSEWMPNAIKKADFVVFTNPNRITMIKWAMKRSKTLKHNLKLKLKYLYWIFRWGSEWYRKYKKQSKQFLELKTNKEIEKFLKDLRYKK